MKVKERETDRQTEKEIESVCEREKMKVNIFFVCWEKIFFWCMTTEESLRRIDKKRRTP